MMFYLQITTLLALRAFAHGVTQLRGRILLLQFTIHLHDLLVPIGRALGNTTGLATTAYFRGSRWGGRCGRSRCFGGTSGGRLRYKCLV